MYIRVEVKPEGTTEQRIPSALLYAREVCQTIVCAKTISFHTTRSGFYIVCAKTDSALIMTWPGFYSNSPNHWGPLRRIVKTCQARLRQKTVFLGVHHQFAVQCKLLHLKA